MDKKRTYRIKNWPEYNKSLIQRRDITLWCSEDAIGSWVLPNEGKRGRPRMYSDEAILCALMVKVVFHLPLRALEGFLFSLLGLLGVLLPVCVVFIDGELGIRRRGCRRHDNRNAKNRRKRLR